nr:hypothetical protein [Deltaproteobacteria bacterium]
MHQRALPGGHKLRQPDRECGGGASSPVPDAASCGGCGVACNAGRFCFDNRCQCPTGQTLCGGVCVDITNAVNCGACVSRCMTNQVCSSGPAVTCPTGTPGCAGACVDHPLHTTATAAAAASPARRVGPAPRARGRARERAGPLRRALRQPPHRRAQLRRLRQRVQRRRRRPTAGVCACPTARTLCNGVCANTQPTPPTAGLRSRLRRGPGVHRGACVALPDGSDPLRRDLREPRGTDGPTAAAAA